MTSKVYPFVLSQLVRDSGNARVFSLDARERYEAIDELTNFVQFGTHRRKYTCALGCGLTNSMKRFLSRAESGKLGHLARMRAVKVVV